MDEAEALAMVWEVLESEFAQEEPLSKTLPGLVVRRVDRPTAGRRIEVEEVVFDVGTKVRADNVRQTIRGKVHEFLHRIVAALLGDAVLPPAPPGSLAEARQGPGPRPTAIVPRWRVESFPKIDFQPVVSSRALEHEPESQIVLVYQSAASYQLRLDPKVEQRGPEHRVTLAATITAESSDRPRVARVGMPSLEE